MSCDYQVYHDHTANLSIGIPEYSLGKGALEIRAVDQTPMHHWNLEQKAKAHDLIRRIAKVWQTDGITQFLVYTRHAADTPTLGWQVVPASIPGEKTLWHKIRVLWHQFLVLWRAAFGGYKVSPTEAAATRQLMPRNLFEEEALILATAAAKADAKDRPDAFCDSRVIANQKIFATKHVSVLYNRAPMHGSEEKLHFLFVPVKHRNHFCELSREEAGDVELLAQALMDYYATRNHGTAYRHHKNGSDAGMSVIHWHEHLVLTNPQNEFSAKVQAIFAFMTGGQRIIPIENKVAALQKELTPVLQQAIETHKGKGT